MYVPLLKVPSPFHFKADLLQTAVRPTHMHSRFLSHLEQNQTTLSAGISFVRKIDRSGRRRDAPVTPPPWRLDGPKWLPNAPHDLPRPPNGWKSAVHLILD